MTTYYVDQAVGSDDNDGSSGSPWETMARAYPHDIGTPNVDAGDTVIVKEGSYGEFQITGAQFPAWEGSMTDPLPSNQEWVTYRAATGETVNLAKIHLTGTLAAVGLCAYEFDGFTIARDDTVLYEFQLASVDGELPNTTFTLEEGASAVDNFYKNLYMLCVTSEGVIAAGLPVRVAAYTGATRSVLLAGVGFERIDEEDMAVGDYIQMVANKSANIYLGNIIGLRLKNLTIPGSTHLSAYKEPAIAQRGGASVYMNDITIDGCTITNAHKGILIGGDRAAGPYCNNITIKNCDISATDDDRIRIDYGSDILLEKNLIHGKTNSGRIDGAYADCIHFNGASSDVTVRKNKMYAHGSQGFWFSNLTYTDFLVENNLIYDCSNYEMKMSDTTNITVRNNTLIGHDFSNQTALWFTGAESPTVNATCYNNLIVTIYTVHANATFAYKDYNIYMYAVSYTHLTLPTICSV